MDLTEPMYILLKALADGRTFAEALLAGREGYHRLTSSDAGPFDQAVFRWMGEFMTEGFFAEIIPPEAT